MGERFLDGTFPFGGAPNGVTDEVDVHGLTKARAA